MTDYTKLIERAEPFMQGLGKAILREIAASFEALHAESASLKQIAELNAQIAIDLKAERDALQAKLGELTKQEPVAQGDPAPLYRAAINCPHEIDHEQVILKYDPKQPGHNALNQLGRRLVSAVAAPKALTPVDFDKAERKSAIANFVESNRTHGIGGTP